METKYLKLLWRTLKECILKLVCTSTTLRESDVLGRYLTSSSQFSTKYNRVKHTAFMPIMNQDSGKFETSLFNINELNDTQVLTLAQKNILPNLGKGRSIYGTGNTNKGNIIDIGLNAEISEPPKRHLNIIDWPDEKSKRKQKAIELAAKSSLNLFESPLKN